MKQIRVIATVLAFLGVCLAGSVTSVKEVETAIWVSASATSNGNNVNGATQIIYDANGNQSNSWEMQISGTAPSGVTLNINGCMRGKTCTNGIVTSSSTSSVLLTSTGLYDNFPITVSWTGGDATTVITINRTATTSKQGGSTSGFPSQTVAGQTIVGGGTTTGAVSKAALDITPYLALHPTDSCKSLNDAILNACSNGIGKVDARGAPGLQACQTNPYAGNTGRCYLDVELAGVGNGTVQSSTWVSAVPWYTPFVGYNLHASGAAGSGGSNGASIALCGPGQSNVPVPGVAYSAGNCTFTDGQGNAQTVVQDTTARVVFNIPHGPFPAGNYQFAIGFHGHGVTGDTFIDGQGWNRDGGYSNFQGISINCGGNPTSGGSINGCFGGYDLNADENSKWRDFRIGGYASFATSATSYSAGILFDRTECCVTQPGIGWARFSIEHLNAAGGLLADNHNVYGIVELGSDITIVNSTLGSCASPVIMWVTAATGGTPTAVAVDPNNNGAGGAATGTCVNPTFTLYGAANCWNGASGPVAGTAGGCTNNAGNNGLNLTATLTPVIANGVVLGATITPGSAYPNSVITGCGDVEWFDFAGSPGNLAETGIYADGCSRGSIKNAHCINLFGACIDMGEVNLTAGGIIGPADAPSASTIVQLGPGIDGNQMIAPLSRQAGNILVDNHHFPPLTLNSTKFPQGIPNYSPTGWFYPGAVGTFGGYFSTNPGTTPSASTLGTSTQIALYGINIEKPIPLNSITFLPSVVDLLDQYIFFICQGVNSPAVCIPIVDTGSVAAALSSATLTKLPWVNAYQGFSVGDILPPGRYYLGVGCLTATTVCGTAKLAGSVGAGAGSLATWFTPGTISGTATQANGTIAVSGFATPIQTPAGNTIVQGTVPFIVLQ